MSQPKNIKKQQKKDKEIQLMVDKLEQQWKHNVKYSCEHCLKEAYDSVITNTNGYVTDEELILSSNNTLRHK